MREIKFRSWNGESMQHGGFSIRATGDVLADSLHGAHPISVMQYTGLKDTNGVEIYDGDILECDEHYYYQISWSEKHSCWYASDCGGLDDLPSSVNVIGNIYQNPDLLK